MKFSSVQSLSHVRLFATPWITACQASLSITNSQSSLKHTSIESELPSSHLILCHPLLLLPPIPPSIRVFSNESTLCMRWPKYRSFNFNIIPSKEIPGLMFFRMDWLDLLAVQGTLKSLLQHHSSKASIFRCSAFFTVQLSHPYMTTGKSYTKKIFTTKNHDGMITHLEPDILECEVKWALESITRNKASGGDGIPTELFQILKDDAVKVLHSICQQIWKTQQWPQDWKRSVFIPIQRKAMPKMLKLLHNCTHLTR